MLEGTEDASNPLNGLTSNFPPQEQEQTQLQEETMGLTAEDRAEICEMIKNGGNVEKPLLDTPIGKVALAAVPTAVGIVGTYFFMRKSDTDAFRSGGVTFKDSSRR